MSRGGHELLQWLLYYFPSSCRSPSPITGLFPQDSYSTFPSPLITQLFINSEQFVCVCGGVLHKFSSSHLILQGNVTNGSPPHHSQNY